MYISSVPMRVGWDRRFFFYLKISVDLLLGFRPFMQNKIYFFGTKDDFFFWHKNIFKNIHYNAPNEHSSVYWKNWNSALMVFSKSYFYSLKYTNYEGFLIRDVDNTSSLISDVRVLRICFFFSLQLFKRICQVLSVNVDIH